MKEKKNFDIYNAVYKTKFIIIYVFSSRDAQKYLQ